MADDPHNTSDVSEPIEAAAVKEDAETTAARRELKQTTISEKAGQNNNNNNDAAQQSQSDDEPESSKKDTTDATARDMTPDTDPGDVSGVNDVLREQVSSPKKKRAHDELVAGDGSFSTLEGEGSSSSKPAGLSAAVAQSRSEESEPEKKRPRDRESSKRRRSSEGSNSGGSSRSSLDKTSEAQDSATTTRTGKNGADKPQTSASAFASSGFAKLAASSTSPFGALGSSGKPSLFGSSASSGSFSVLGGQKPAAAAPSLSAAPKLSFASGGSSSPSPFALNGAKGPSVFGGGFGSSFGGGSSAFGGGSSFGGGSALSGSALSGSRLSTFGKPGEALKSDKPAKPFGAPESDGEEGSEKEDEDEDETGSDKEDVKDADKKEESKELSEEKKKLRLQKIVVDDGESGEVTLLAVRAKMFLMEKGVGWKERGGGMLKVNVPKSTIEFDDGGNPDPLTFDASVLAEEEEEDGAPKIVRLIMRQDHTLRVILNTAVLPAMKFQLTPKLKAAFVLFTAFEDGEARQVQMKMSDANATLFTQLMEVIKKQLADV